MDPSGEKEKPELLVNRWAKEGKVHYVPKPICQCLNRECHGFDWGEMPLHTERQDTTLPAWQRLLQVIDDAIADKRSELSLAHILEPGDWAQILTLPKSIAQLKDVKHLNLYGSSLVRIPPEIGQMESLKEFTPYTSRMLHWFPYEITRCKKLRDSTVSTRSIYGNYKFNPPFPKLPVDFDEIIPSDCSVCGAPFSGNNEVKQVWISLSVATDVMPLLVHACSEQCIERLPDPPKGNVYLQRPHTGGLGARQTDGINDGEKNTVREKVENAEQLMRLGEENGSTRMDRQKIKNKVAKLISGLLHDSCHDRDVEMTKRLIDLGADVNELDEFQSMSLLMEAADEGFLAGVELLLEHGADPDLETPSCESPNNSAVYFARNGLKEWGEMTGGIIPEEVKSQYQGIINLLERYSR